jgi:glycogen debranching enzyme
MDNQPRQEKGYDPMVSHGFMSWIDTCAQQYLSADILVKMAHELGRDAEAKWLREEMERLYSIVNGKMWSERDGFYYDTRRDGSHSGVKTVGAYWTLLAGLVPKDRVDAFVSHLENEAEFKRTHRVPALSADDPHYDPNGGYFCGGVWPQTNYMVLMGLDRVGYSDLAYEIAVNHVENVTKVFNATSQVYENYAPEAPLPGDPAKAGYVGWAGLGPISVLFEYVFGIRTDAPRAYVEWNVRRTERHGVLRLPVGNIAVDLICEARENENSEPTVKVLSNAPVTVKIKWKSGEKTVYGGRS